MYFLFIGFMIVEVIFSFVLIRLFYVVYLYVFMLVYVFVVVLYYFIIIDFDVEFDDLLWFVKRIYDLFFFVMVFVILMIG